MQVVDRRWQELKVAAFCGAVENCAVDSTTRFLLFFELEQAINLSVSRVVDVVLDIGIEAILTYDL